MAMSEVLTKAEAAAYLRLEDLADPERAVDRLVDAGRLRAMTYSKARLFSVDELRRFLAAETERTS